MLSPLGATTTKPQLDYSSPSKAAVATASHASMICKDGKLSDKLSSAIRDVSNGENWQKQQWKMDFDISAPIIILPENCTGPHAKVLICNLGWFKFAYGTEALSIAVRGRRSHWMGPASQASSSR